MIKTQESIYPEVILSVIRPGLLVYTNLSMPYSGSFAKINPAPSNFSSLE